MTSNLDSLKQAKPVAGSVCEVRVELLDQLARAVEKLGRAKLNLRDCLEDGTFMPGEFVAGQVEQLRKSCVLIRSELEQHRSLHGC